MSIEITDEMVDDVGDEIGMHHGGWDTENPKDIIRASVLVVLRRLSPAVRELLVSNPEAVEKCVRAVKVTIKSRTPGESTTYSQSLQSMNAAIAALKPGRDEG